MHQFSVGEKFRNIAYYRFITFLEGLFDKFTRFPKEFKEGFLYTGKFFLKSFPYKGNVL